MSIDIVRTSGTAPSRTTRLTSTVVGTDKCFSFVFRGARVTRTGVPFGTDKVITAVVPNGHELVGMFRTPKFTPVSPLQ